VEEYVIEPSAVGLERCRLEDLRSGSAEESSRVVRAVLEGQKGATRDVVLLNSGAALYVVGSAGSVEAGIALAAESIDSGKANQKLTQLIRMTNAT
jgi:anthranilate phosphoribosyltransferase